MPEPEGGSSASPPVPAKPPAPKIAVLGDERVTVNALAFKVFEALTKPEQLAGWWGQDVVVEADEGGRYETTLPVGRVEGTITAIQGPQKLSFNWELPAEDHSVVTSVYYELVPKGPQTVVHLSHRAPREVPGDWGILWKSLLDSLKTYVEAGSGTEAPADAQ